MRPGALPVLGAVVGALAAVAMGSLALVRKVKRRKADVFAEMDREIIAGRTAKRIDDMATFLGLSSKGPVQLRGNGTLVLLDDELAFGQWFPRTTIRIPLRDVIEVDAAKSHLGKTLFTPLLRVHWRIDAGEETVAWRVRDPSGWIADLKALSVASSSS